MGRRRGNHADRVKSKRRRRRRRTRGPRGPRVDITRGVQLPGERQRFHDPPYRSLSEGRGLPHTPLIKAMLPVMVLLAGATLAVTLLLGMVATLLG